MIKFHFQLPSDPRARGILVEFPFSLWVGCISSSSVSPSACYFPSSLVFLLLPMYDYVYILLWVDAAYGGLSFGPPGFWGHLSEFTLSRLVDGSGLCLRAVWPASSHLAVVNEALFWLYVDLAMSRHGLVKCLLFVLSSVCYLFRLVFYLFRA